MPPAKPLGEPRPGAGRLDGFGRFWRRPQPNRQISKKLSAAAVEMKKPRSPEGYEPGLK
jgi:hypothetical protein